MIDQNKSAESNIEDTLSCLTIPGPGQIESSWNKIKVSKSCTLAHKVFYSQCITTRIRLKLYNIRQLQIAKIPCHRLKMIVFVKSLIWLIKI